MWGYFNYNNFIFIIIDKIIWIIGIFAAALVIFKLSKILIQKFFIERNCFNLFYIEEKRLKTLGTLLTSVIKYILFFATGLIILREFKIDTTSIVAGLGIIGLTLGVGAQNLIKDYLNGFFIIIEDQYAVGDYIVIGEMMGTVVEIGFRITKLRDANGILHILPNGSITKISNLTRGHMQAIINVPISKNNDIDKALNIINEICNEMTKCMPEILEIPEVIGIVEIHLSELIVRIIAKTIPLTEGKVAAALRYKINLKLKQEKIGFI